MHVDGVTATDLLPGALDQSPRSVSLAVHAPLAGLSGSPLSSRFRSWRGASGRRYLFSVFGVPGGDGLDQCPGFNDAVVLAVARDGSDDRTILCVEETGPLPDLFYSGARLRAAMAQGANEVHVHLLAEDAGARRAIVRDLQG